MQDDLQHISSVKSAATVNGVVSCFSQIYNPDFPVYNFALSSLQSLFIKSRLKRS